MAGVNLNDAIKNLNQGDAVIVRGVVPNRGMANALATYDKYEVRGGKGSQYGGLETRVSSLNSTAGFLRDSYNGMVSQFRDWSRDPLAYKAKIAENKKLSEEARKNSVTLSQQQLMIQQPRTLFSGSSNYQLSLMSGTFQLIQVQTRYIIALAKSLGVDTRKMLQPNPDPKKSWIGSVFSSIADDIKKIPGVNPAIRVSKHLVNIASIINPFSMGSRAMKGVEGFGNLLQRFFLGKKGYDYMRDPKLAYADAGLNLKDSTKLVNLAKVQANYAREQLNTQYNILRVVQSLARTLGADVTTKRLNITHNEYSGDLKTYRQSDQERLAREQRLAITYQKAHRGGIYGKITPFIAPFVGGMQSVTSRRNPGKANNLDKQMLQDMYRERFLESIGDPRLQRIVQNLPYEFDWFNPNNENIVNSIKNIIFEMNNGVGFNKDDIDDQKRFSNFKKNFDYYKKQAKAREFDQLNSRLTYRTANFFTPLSGHHVTSTKESIQKQRNVERYGNNLDYARTMSGAPGVDILKEYQRSSLGSIFTRMIPIFGIFSGIRQAIQQNQLENLYDKIIRSGKQTDVSGEFGIGTFGSSQSVNIKSNVWGQSPIKTTLVNNPIYLAFREVLFEVFYKIPVKKYAAQTLETRSLAGSIAAMDGDLGEKGNTSSPPVAKSLYDISNRLIQYIPSVGGLVQDQGTNDGRQTSVEVIAAIEKEQEKKREEEKDKRNEKFQEVVAGALIQLNDNVDPESKKNKLIALKDKVKNKLKSGGNSILDFFKGNIGKLGVLSSLLFGTETGRNIMSGLVSTVFTGIGKLFTEMLPRLSEAAMNHFKEHPLLDSTLLATVVTKMFPGFIGSALSGVFKAGISNPTIVLGTIAAGGLLYNVVSSYNKVKESGGGFGDIIKEIFIGSKGSIQNAFGKAGTYAIVGATAGSVVPGIGTIVGFLGGAAIGGIIGGLGMDGIAKYVMRTSKIVCDIIGWKPGSAEYKLAQLGNFAPYLGPLLFGLIGKILPDSITNFLIPGTTSKDETQKKASDEYLAEKKKAENEHRLYRRGNFLTGYQETILTPEENSKYNDPKTSQDEKDRIYRSAEIRTRSKRNQDMWSDKDKEKVTRLRTEKGRYGGDTDSDYLGGTWFGDVVSQKEVEKSNHIDYQLSATRLSKMIPSHQSSIQKNKEFIPHMIPSHQSSSAPVVANPSTATNILSQNGSTGGSSSSGLNWIEQFIADSIKGAFNIGGKLLNWGSQVYNNAFNGGQADISGIDISNLGSLSAMFESGGKSETIGYDIRGGTSYGKYQLSSKQGSMLEFLNYIKTNGGEAGKKIYNTMYEACGGNWGNLNTGSRKGRPVDAWRGLANSGILGNLEDDFFSKYFFATALNKLSYGPKQLVDKSSALKQVLWSTAVQHGVAGASKIFNDAYRDGINTSEFVSNIYNIRGTKFQNSEYRDSVLNRFQKEKNIALALVQREQGVGGVQALPKGAWKGYPNISSDDLSRWKLDASNQLVWPTSSTVITSPMGFRATTNGASSAHMGVDIGASFGSPVMSAMSGYVESVDPNINGGVVVRHPNGWASKYLHLSKIGVKPGDSISAGQEIGLSGKRGQGNPNRWPAHLHFEMAKGDERVDPEAVFYNYQQSGGSTAYRQHTYNSDIAPSRRFQSKLAGHYGKNSGGQTDSIASGDPLDSKAGGDMFGDYKYSKIRSNVNEYLNTRVPKDESKVDDMIKELREIKAAFFVSAKETSKPNIAVIPTPQGGVSSDNGGNKITMGDSGLDRSIDRIFSQVGNMISNFNIAHTNLAVTTT